MKTHALALAVTGALLALAAAPHDARACGGCFAQTETTQVVTDHRMVMAIHANESILWDQIRYSGDPAEFSWVLPVSGNVTVELASEIFFDELEQISTVRVQSPFVRTNCGGGGMCAGGASNYSADRGGQEDTVQVLSEATVGPYETVTLRSTDAGALDAWLTSHGYVVPASVRPVVDSYVAMHMDFVALRLQPGQGVKAMEPIRVRYAGANMVLPLRMIAAGAGEKLGITLWVFGSGRYEASNFANALVDPGELVWDWDTQKSNYPEAFELALAHAGGHAFVTEYAANTSYLYIPDDGGTGADGGAQDDWTLARGGPRGSDAPYEWVTRLRTNLPINALDADLILQASANSSAVNNTLTAEKTTGTYPGVTCSALISVAEPAEEAEHHPGRFLAGAAASILAAAWLRRRRRAN